MALFAVLVERCGEWDWSRGLREQDGFDEHAAFMDFLTDEGFILLGGPFQTGKNVLHVIEAADEAAVRARFGEDPWSGTRLRIARIERWEVLLGLERLAALRDGG